MKNSNFFKIGFIILVLLNIGLMAALMFRPKPPRNKRSPDMKGRLIRQLKLTEQQQDAYFEMIAIHRNQMNVLNKEHGDLIRLYFNHFTGKSDNQPDRDSLLNQIQLVEGDKVKGTYQHFESIYNILDAEQQEQFTRVSRPMIDNILGNRKKKHRRPKD